MLQLVDSTDPVLRQTTVEFDFKQDVVDPEQLVHEMTKTMQTFHGIGLAGPQVDCPFAVFTMGWDDKFTSIFNPKIIKASDNLVPFDEGCLSFPGLVLRINRPDWVEVEFQNAQGDVVHERFTELHARVFQHEYDHLGGICFDKKVSKLKLDMAKKRAEKLKRKIEKLDV